MSEGPPKNAAPPLTPEERVEQEQKLAEARANALVPTAREVAFARANTISAHDTQQEEPNQIYDIPESETVRQEEYAPKDWREKLRGLVGGFITGAKEKLGMSERGERLKEHLAGRSQSQQEEAKRFGPKAVEAIGSLVGRYNKLNWKTKLAVTGALMTGVAFTPVTLPLLSGALSAALYGQRVVGGIGMAMNKRKALDAKIAAKQEHWLAGKSELAKNAYAAALSVMYMGATSAVVHEGVEALRAVANSEWLGGLLGYSQPEHAGVVPDAPAHSDAPMHTGDEAVSAAPESSAPETAAPSSETVTEDLRLPSKGAHVSVPIPEEAPVIHHDASPADTTVSQEWHAEYADQEHYTGAPEWRAEHVESETVPEAAAETPASPDTAPQTMTPEEVVTAPNAIPADTSPGTVPADVPSAPPQAEAPAPAPEASHLTVNVHGLPIDESHASAYLDAQKNLIVHGGGLSGLDARAELAKQLVAKDHSAVVYFDSTRSWLPFWHHLSKAYWVEGQGINIVDETNDATLQGVNLPGIDDLKEAYAPATSATANFHMPPRADMPITAPNPDDIPRVDMPTMHTGDGLNRPEMQLDKQHIPSGLEMNPHALGHIESGSIKGDFGYSQDGAVTSFNYSGVSHGEFQTLLNDDYGTTLLNRPGNHGLARSVVENRARDLFNRVQVLNELIKRGADNSPETDFMRKSIAFSVEQTEKIYGDVFKDMPFSKK